MTFPNNQKQPGEKCFGPTSVPGGNGSKQTPDINWQVEQKCMF